MLPSSGAIVCTVCGYTCRYSDLPDGGAQISVSAEKPEPEWVKKARAAVDYKVGATHRGGGATFAVSTTRLKPSRSFGLFTYLSS